MVCTRQYDRDQNNRERRQDRRVRNWQMRHTRLGTELAHGCGLPSRGGKQIDHFTEELWDGDTLLTVALITFDIRGTSGGTCVLHLTDQVTSFVGYGGVRGRRDGYTRALDNKVWMFSAEVSRAR